jgi:hypothetical protein
MNDFFATIDYTAFRGGLFVQYSGRVFVLFIVTHVFAELLKPRGRMNLKSSLERELTERMTPRMLFLVWPK